MQMHKWLKVLFFALPVIVVAACSSNKNANNYQLGVSSSPLTEEKSSNLSFEKQSRVRIQELQKYNTVYFALNKYEISSNFIQMLDTHVMFLRSNAACKVIIEGYTDERGTPEYNIALGERRANAVKSYLQSKGVLADQISIVSYGKAKPALLGHDETDYAENRRVLLVY